MTVTRCLALLLLLLSPLVMAAAPPVPEMDSAEFDRYLEANKGKVVVVNFWATWCPPCKWEIPDFVKAYKEHREDGLEILGLSLDGDEERVQKFLSKNEVNYTIRLGAGDLRQRFNAFMIPVTVVFGRDGTQAKRVEGYMKPEALEELLLTHLGPR